MNEVNFNRMFGQQGWICPKCGRVYSPFTQMCLYCGNNNSENTFTSANTPTKLSMRYSNPTKKFV